MEPNRKEGASSNIPHMHLFMYLKHRFPGLKDADITDSIQRFGLNKIRCEDELSRRSQEQHRGYYSPWNRSRASSRGSPGSRNSPFSSSETHSRVSSPLQNGNSPSTPFSGQSQFPLNQCFTDTDKEHAEHPSQFNFNTTATCLQTSETKAVYSCASSSQVLTTPSYYNHQKYPTPSLANNEFTRAANGFTNHKEEASSAPVIPESREPFFDPLFVHRRSSAETVSDRRKQLLDPRICREDPNEISIPRTLHENTSENPAKVFSNPSSPTKTTMTSPSNAPTPATTRTNFISSPIHRQTPQNQHYQQQHQQPPAVIQEQFARKERLKEELNQRLEEKTRLEGEVKSLTKELESREKSQRQEVIRSKEEIELIQQKNSRLQYDCDEMERQILESGESPKTDQEGRVLNDLVSPSFQDSSLRIPPQQPLPRTGSASSLSSGGAGTPTTPLVPSRKAPSPPISTSTSPSVATIRRQGVDQANRRPATIGSDEGKGWSCSKCTFLNSSFLKECEICGFPDFSLVRDI